MLRVNSLGTTTKLIKVKTNVECSIDGKKFDR